MASACAQVLSSSSALTSSRTAAQANHPQVHLCAPQSSSPLAASTQTARAICCPTTRCLIVCVAALAVACCRVNKFLGPKSAVHPARRVCVLLSFESKASLAPATFLCPGSNPHTFAVERSILCTRNPATLSPSCISSDCAAMPWCPSCQYSRGCNMTQHPGLDQFCAAERNTETPSLSRCCPHPRKSPCVSFPGQPLFLNMLLITLQTSL